MSKRIVLAKGGAIPAEGHTTRRAALGALASAGAFVIPKIGAMAAPSEPIFAAIERHRVAWTAVGAISPSVDEVAAMRKGREVSQADWDAYERASAIEEAAFDQLLTTVPTTAAGMRMSIEYLIRFDDGCLSDSARPLLVDLLKSPLFAIPVS